VPKISGGGASGGGQLAVPANAYVREDGVVTAPPSLASPSDGPAGAPVFGQVPAASGSGTASMWLENLAPSYAGATGYTAAKMA